MCIFAFNLFRNLKKKVNKNEEVLLSIIIEAIQEKKGKDIALLDLRGLEQAVCDYFIICHGDSSTQVGALTGCIEEFAMKKAGIKPFHVEGMQNAQWVLLDFMDIVVHVFQKEFRFLYQLEQLWSDAKIKNIED